MIISSKRIIVISASLISILMVFDILSEPQGTYILDRRHETKSVRTTTEDLVEASRSTKRFSNMNVEIKTLEHGKTEETAIIARIMDLEQDPNIGHSHEKNGSEFERLTADKQESIIPDTETVEKRYEKLLGCRRLPDIIIIGFEKCGTVTLNTYLGIHPKIFNAPEDNYQLFNEGLTLSDRMVEEHTKDKPCTPTGMLRLNKLGTWGRAENTYKVIPNAKMLAIVREPVERVMSHYVHRLEMGIESQQYNFDDIIASIMIFNRPISLQTSVLFSQSRFIEKLEPWIEMYGLGNIHIVDGDNFVRDPVQELEKVETFLGINHFITRDHFVYNPEKGFYCLKAGENTTCMTAEKGRPHLQMSNQTRVRLQQYFKPFNERLFETIGRNFWWNY